MVWLRSETKDDIPAIRSLIAAAFEQADEADLVDALRESGALSMSHVADRKSEIVGHVAFSPLEIVGEDDQLQQLPSIVLALAPMAVAPELQRTGVGTGLLKSAMARLAREDVCAIVVLGHPEYYPRFGFVPASRYELKCPIPVPDEAFMLWTPKPLDEGVLRGTVRYASAFGMS